MALSQDQAQALQRVIEYLAEEERDFHERPSSTHIWQSVEKLRALTNR
jgi:hypothetical protein